MKTMKNFILSLVAMLVVSTGFSQVEYKIGVYGDIVTVHHNNLDTINVDVSDSIIFISGSFQTIKGIEFFFNFDEVNNDGAIWEYYDESGQFSYDILTFSSIGEINVWNDGAHIIINVTNVNTATIFENEIQVTALNAYPNPVVDYLNVEFETELSEVEISVMNGAGQTIFIDNAVRWNGSNKVVVPMSDQPNGLYFVRIGNETRKVIKQ